MFAHPPVITIQTAVVIPVNSENYRLVRIDIGHHNSVDKDKMVAAVTLRPEFEPSFDLVYNNLSQGVLHWRPRGDLNP